MKKPFETNYVAQLDFFLMMSACVLAQWRGFLFSPFLPASTPWWVALLWLLLGSVMVVRVYKNGVSKRFFSLWKQNWMLFLFILFCISSLIWTIDPGVSLYRLAAMVGASLAAAYIGVRYSLSEFLSMLSNAFIFLVLVSMSVVFLFPELGIMSNEPYNGSWRGIYWHRNYLGSGMALANLVFLYRLAEGKLGRRFSVLLYGIFYILSAALIFLSRSATGLILFLLLQAAFCFVWVWQRYSSRLKSGHYYGISALLIVSALLILTNLDVVFGLLGRNTSLTGRVPLWNYLLTSVLPEQGFLGFGFGALWAQLSFRRQVQSVLGWGYPVLTADNGFLDVLLYVGFAGFVSFLGALVHGITHFLRHYFHERNLISSLPAVFAAYMLVANVSLSHFFEIEYFTWMIFISFLFSVSAQRSSDAD